MCTFCAFTTWLWQSWSWCCRCQKLEQSCTGLPGVCDNPIGLLPAALDVALLHAWAAFTIICRGFLIRAEQLPQQAGHSPLHLEKLQSFLAILIHWGGGGVLGSLDQVLWLSGLGMSIHGPGHGHGRSKSSRNKRGREFKIHQDDKIFQYVGHLDRFMIDSVNFVSISIFLSKHCWFFFLGKTAKTPPTYWQPFCETKSNIAGKKKYRFLHVD